MTSWMEVVFPLPLRLERGSIIVCFIGIKWKPLAEWQTKMLVSYATNPICFVMVTTCGDRHSCYYPHRHYWLCYVVDDSDVCWPWKGKQAALPFFSLFIPVPPWKLTYLRLIICLIMIYIVLTTNSGKSIYCGNIQFPIQNPCFSCDGILIHSQNLRNNYAIMNLLCLLIVLVVTGATCSCSISEIISLLDFCHTVHSNPRKPDHWWQITSQTVKYVI